MKNTSASNYLAQKLTAYANDIVKRLEVAEKLLAKADNKIPSALVRIRKTLGRCLKRANEIRARSARQPASESNNEFLVAAMQKVFAESAAVTKDLSKFTSLRVN